MSDAASKPDDALLLLNSAGDTVIVAVCCGLSVLLLRLARRRADLPRPGIIALAAFLLLLGVVHALTACDPWHAQSWLLASAKNAAAATAIIATVLLWRRLPELLSLPGQEQLDCSQAALQLARDELESFMGAVSHDLRSPLTTIAGQAGLLELSLGANATADLKRRVQRIQHSVRHMSQLIEALLALSRISRRELQLESLDISALAQSAVAELRRKEPYREVAVTIQPQLHARGDPHLVAELLAHVLGNAWKFTARTASASIEVGVSKDTGTPALYVRDNGAGFDMVYESKLFKPFQRLHPPAEFEGAGVGLASAARIVARHGGRIWVQAAPNAGAMFYFTLPGL